MGTCGGSPETRRPIPFSDAEFAIYAEAARGREVKARLRPVCDEMSRRTTSSLPAGSSNTASIAA